MSSSDKEEPIELEEKSIALMKHRVLVVKRKKPEFRLVSYSKHGVSSELLNE